ncbi:hypothetical protein EZV62_007154 [Acer yangbiense]|uniref:Disease resistance protein At4g27190-like leucine-rich repeats domain-containing protein n=1 Tax=Acer yangbiense TaxID=1000413 RepID=A0A5C7IAW9_9ROSI|nr:hypothetical protein EZV62_007154 [Acer yangbiense]
MHDVVCDDARSIASQNEHVFTVIDDFIPRDWVYENTLENCTRISLHNIIELPEKLVCPKFMFLYIKSKVSFLRIHDQFFLEMPKLQVLHLVEMYLGSLPMSLGRLVNLKTLCLEECKLSNATIIRDLKKLEILSFRGSQIMKLPEEMHQLISLRLLDLTDCSKLRVIPAKVMSSLTQLEALYLENTSIRWEMETDKVERSNAILDELKHLSNLTTLEIHIPDAKMSKGLLSHKLERYKIFIGDHSKSWSMYGKAKYETSRALTLKLQTSEVGIITQLKGIKSLHLDQIPSVSNLLNELGREGSLELRHLKVQNSPYTSCIINSMQPVSSDALPTLETLSLSRLIKLERICNGELGTTSFQQLKIIKVNKCDRLNNIFSFSTDNGLPQLEEIAVINFSRMEEIFVIERQDDVNNTEVNKTIQVSLLRVVTLGYMQCLKSLCSKVKTIDTNAKGVFISENKRHISESLFNEMVVLPNMETLNLSDIDVEKIWHNQLPRMSSSVQNLTRLIIKGCRNLKNIFSASLVNSFVQLQHLEIIDCPVLEEMVVIEEGRRDIKLLFPQLHYLRINHLVKLRKLYSGNYIEFPSLKEMEIVNCFQLREFIFDDKTIPEFFFNEMVWINPEEKRSTIATTHLRNLSIKYSPTIKSIWNKDPRGMLSFENLLNIQVLECQDLKNLFPASVARSLSKLEYLSICDCSVLKEIVAKERFVEEEAATRACLEKVDYELWQVKIFPSDNISKHETDKKQQQPFFLVEKAFPCLEELKLTSGENIAMMWEGHIPKGLFHTLEILEVCYDESTVLPLCIIQRLHNPEKLSLYSGSYEMIFSSEGILKQTRTPVKIRKLALSRLKDLNLRSFCSGNYILEFPSLEKLTVEGCDEMEIFSRGVLSTPALRKVKIDWELIEPDVDLNKTIQQLYEKEGSDKDYGDFSRHDPNDQSFEEDYGDSSRKSDEDCGGSSRHHQNDQCSDEDSSDSS